MIKQWVQAGNDWIAVDDQNRSCYVIKPLDDESIIQRLKVSEIGSQHAREPCTKQSGVPDVLRFIDRKRGGNQELSQCMDVLVRAFKGNK
jgi:uncharacterized protein YycO